MQHPVVRVDGERQGASATMRILVHDFGGHPFVFELSRALARRGHQVCHLFFADFPGPKGNAETLPDDPAGLTITSVAIDREYRVDSMASRLRGNLAYARQAAEHVRRFAPDVVLSGNAPTEVQAQVQRAAHLAGARFVYWMQDIYSVAVATLLRRKWGPVGSLAGWLYRQADRVQLARSDGIVVITDAFADELENMGVDGVPTWTIANWGALTEIDIRPKDNDWARRHGLNNRFVFLYSGTLGMKHDPMLLVHLAKAIDSASDAVVVVAAHGAGRFALERHLTTHPVERLRLLPLQPIADLPDMLGTADVTVALLEADAGRFSVPSKILSNLCAGRPTILSAPPANLASQVLRDAGAGVAVAAGNAEAFVAAALSLATAPDDRARMGAAARHYAEETFAIEGVADRFERVFAEIRPGG